MEGVEQYDVVDFGLALQRFTSADYDTFNPDANEMHSLVYYLEQMDGPSLKRSNKIASTSFIDDGGSIHLYLSTPGTAALDNHTDTTDIVVLQQRVALVH